MAFLYDTAYSAFAKVLSSLTYVHQGGKEAVAFNIVLFLRNLQLYVRTIFSPILQRR